MLQCAHFDSKGGNRTFAALCAKVCYAGQLDEINASLPSEMVWKMPTVRLLVRGKRLRKLLGRHEHNNKLLVSADSFAVRRSDCALSA
jgi:hypothetical protein